MTQLAAVVRSFFSRLITPRALLSHEAIAERAVTYNRYVPFRAGAIYARDVYESHRRRVRRNLVRGAVVGTLFALMVLCAGCSGGSASAVPPTGTASPFSSNPFGSNPFGTASDTLAGASLATPLPIPIAAQTDSPSAADDASTACSAIATSASPAPAVSPTPAATSSPGC